MPPIRKYNKESIIEAAYEIVKKEGLESLNARRLAKKLGCSIQPIFHNFASMEELNKEVYQKIYAEYQRYMLSGKDSEKPYKEMGMSYICFAKDYPEFFKIIFMQETNLKADAFIMADNLGEDVMKAGQVLTGLSYEEQRKFHVKVWMFTHGIACLVATKTIEISLEEIENLLTSTVGELLKGIEKGEQYGKCN